jgi:glycosyltransferase involved in cell wall biosynthesis
MNKKIVIFINSLGGGGAEGVCATIANSLFERKWRVTLLLLHLHGTVRQKEINPAIECAVLNKRHARSSFFALLHWLLIHKPEKILVFNYQLAVLLVIIRLFSRMQFRIISRNINTLSEKKRNEKSFWHKHIAGSIVTVLYKHVDLIIAQSQGMKEDLVANYGIANSDIVVINNPISKKIEYFLSQNKLPLKADDNYIICAGALEPKKAVNYAIEAFARIAGNYPQLRLKILGQGSLETQLKQLVANKNIADKVDFEGYREDIIPYYFHARLTILTSLFEGFPNVLIESIALGTPVVSFDCPSGPSEIVQDGVNGYLVKYQDMDHLIECLRRALDREWDAKTVMVTANRFSSEKIIDEYERVLA